MELTDWERMFKKERKINADLSKMNAELQTENYNLKEELKKKNYYIFTLAQELEARK